MAVNRPTTSIASTSTTTFDALGVPSLLTEALATAGVHQPFPIQAATLPDSLAGRDVLGRGRTGSGKTYAFLIPVLARLAAEAGRRSPGRPRALILAPTRELASQIEASAAPLAKVLGLHTLTVFGGVRPGPQIAALRAGVDLLIACPGRLADHLQSGHVRLDSVRTTVLDEADHMADLGFLPVVRRLLDRTPSDGQRLLFSATLDAGVDVLVRQYLHDPVTHSVDTARSPVSTMAHHMLHVGKDSRLPVLVDLTSAPGRSLVFTRTKRGATRLTRQLVAAGVPAVELHGNLGQNARTRNLSAFADGSVTTLVATDIAARGIHVDDIGVVIHADPPVEHKAYLHRSGRTARAGASGTVITLMTDEQVADVRELTRKAGIKPTVTQLRAGHPLLAQLAPGVRTLVAAPTETAGSPGSAGPGGGRRRPRRQQARTGGSSSTKTGENTARTGAGAKRTGGNATRTGGGAAQPGRRRAAATASTTASGSAAAFSAGAKAGRRHR